MHVGNAFGLFAVNTHVGNWQTANTMDAKVSVQKASVQDTERVDLAKHVVPGRFARLELFLLLLFGTRFAC